MSAFYSLKGSYHQIGFQNFAIPDQRQFTSTLQRWCSNLTTQVMTDTSVKASTCRTCWRTTQMRFYVSRIRRVWIVMCLWLVWMQMYQNLYETWGLLKMNWECCMYSCLFRSLDIYIIRKINLNILYAVAKTSLSNCFASPHDIHIKTTIVIQLEKKL